jgi:hypothetical protein
MPKLLIHNLCEVATPTGRQWRESQGHVLAARLPADGVRLRESRCLEKEAVCVRRRGGQQGVRAAMP